MKQLLIALCLLCSCQVADARPGRYRPPAQERIFKLPQDAGKPYLTLTGNPTTGRVRELDGWFRSHPQLSQVANQTHYRVIDSGSPLAARLKPIAAGTVVRLQDAEGRVIAELANGEIPVSPEALTRALNAELPQCIFRRNRGGCPIEPQPPAVVVPDDPPAQPLDDYSPPADESPSFPWLLLGCVVVSSFCGGSLLQWYRTYKRAS